MMINLKGMEFESICAKIILLIARNGNKLITTVYSLSEILEEEEEKVKKELMHMSRNRIIGMRLINGSYKVKDIEVKGKYLELNIKQYTDSLIAINSNLFYTGVVNESREAIN